MKVVFIGGGNMASALVSGLLANGTAIPEDLLVVDISDEVRHKFDAMKINTASAFSFSDFNADVVILAVKPQHLRKVVESCASNLKDSLIVSIVAGIPIA